MPVYASWCTNACARRLPMEKAQARALPKEGGRANSKSEDVGFRPVHDCLGTRSLGDAPTGPRQRLLRVATCAASLLGALGRACGGSSLECHPYRNRSPEDERNICGK